MINNPPPTLLVTLNADEYAGRIVVPLEPFLHFAEDIRQDLEDLEYRWKYNQTPVRKPVGIIRGKQKHPR